MKKSAWIVLLLLTVSLTFAQVELYLQDSLVLELKMNGELELVPKSHRATVKSVIAELFLIPQETKPQKVISNSVIPKQNSIEYSWVDGQTGIKTFGYNAEILTKNIRQKVRIKIPFPLTEVSGNEEYLKATKTIDSDNPEIVAKATELAEGEDDLFKVVFKLASWVEESVNYDLNTLTAKASQKASWVLENKQGVCDEMTSLFIAMARSLGIPARFVKGISYSTSELFSNPWQPHGWGEVYFPTIGWVSLMLPLESMDMWM